ncbi:MAG: cobalt ECF transporter T component CbiQ, partial [Nitrospinota bacterium]
MHYLPVDKYCGVKSLIHNLDPRVKIGGLVLYILAVVSTKPEAYSSFLLYGLLVFLLLFLSKIPLSYLLKRSAVVIPFVFFIT